MPEPGRVQFVAHTHPTAVNALTCSVAFETAFDGRLFPDEIVLCGPAPLLIPYTDPGVPFARKAKELIDGYLDRYGEPPRVILMQNHGLIALGHSASHVESITAMMVKTARVVACARWTALSSRKNTSTGPALYRRQQLVSV